eukprot:14897-Heterococcus_DN1.PRE.1
MVCRRSAGVRTSFGDRHCPFHGDKHTTTEAQLSTLQLNTHHAVTCVKTGLQNTLQGHVVGDSVRAEVSRLAAVVGGEFAPSCEHKGGNACDMQQPGTCLISENLINDKGRSSLGTQAAKRPRSLQVDAAALRHDATEILPYLYLGSDSLACDLDSLLQCNISHIVDCRFPACNSLCGSTDARCLQLQYLSLPVADEASQGSAIRKDFDISSRHIEAARRSGKACLVHCSAGERTLLNTICVAMVSPTVAVCYVKLFELTRQTGQNYCCSVLTLLHCTI